MATINFLVNDGGGTFNTDLGGSGLGFYGPTSFGASVAVGAYQDATYVTGTGGLEEGTMGMNVKWRHANSGEIASSTLLNLINIPNNKATLNIRFSATGTPVNVQNAELRIYDRSNIANGASGVVAKVAEIIHTGVANNATGLGDTAWHTPSGATDPCPLNDNPGTGGTGSVGGTGVANQHDWYLALSCSPNSIGSKTQFGLYCSVEYL